MSLQTLPPDVLTLIIKALVIAESDYGIGFYVNCTPVRSIPWKYSDTEKIIQILGRFTILNKNMQRKIMLHSIWEEVYQSIIQSRFKVFCPSWRNIYFNNNNQKYIPKYLMKSGVSYRTKSIRLMWWFYSSCITKKCNFISHEDQQLILQRLRNSNKLLPSVERKEERTKRRRELDEDARTWADVQNFIENQRYMNKKLKFRS
jgi:hypothetical protein